MATTIPQAFQKLRANLEITDLQASTVSTRQANVRQAIEAELKVLDSFLTGSYKRNTMIAPLAEADVDIFVVLNPEYYSPTGQAVLLDKVKRVLKKTYPESPDISRNGQAVTITFSDFRVDVVPAFNRQGGGYRIPDSVFQRWIETDPTHHVTYWTEQNKVHAGALVPLLKMIKGWNKENGALLRSFHLEATTLQVMRGVTLPDFPAAVRYVFDKARVTVQNTPDPAGYGGSLNDYLDTAQKLTDVLSRLETAYNRALAAEDLGRRSRITETFEKWNLVFGSYFPAYG